MLNISKWNNFYLLTPFSFVIEMITAKTKLSEVEEWATYQADIENLP